MDKSPRGSTEPSSPVAELVTWYSAKTGIVFGVGLLLAALLILAGQSSIALLLVIILISVVVPWKLLRQRQEVAELTAKVDELSATAARVEQVNARVDHVHTVAATIEQVNSVRTWANSISGRVDSVKERVDNAVSNDQIQTKLANFRRDNIAPDLAAIRTNQQEQTSSIRRLEANREGVKTRINGFATKDAELGLAIERLRTEVEDLPDLRKTSAAVERRQADIVDEIDLRRENARKVVIGLGTGRSGTSSLHHLLDSQVSSFISHERRPLLPWDFSEELIEERIEQLMDSPTSVVGDIAFYYLPYVRFLAEKLPEARFVCMRRNRQKVVDSFMTKTDNDNLWQDHDGTEWDFNALWDPTMPSYPAMAKDEAIGRYWDEYYEVATQLSNELGDRFEIFDLEGLFGDADTVQHLLDFIGIERSRQRVIVDVHVNEILTRRDAETTT